jgi:hypothetical protein
LALNFLFAREIVSDKIMKINCFEGKYMASVFVNLMWAAVFIIIAAIVGIILIIASTFVVPRILNRLTPTIDEDKEIARGNRAVADYFGRIVSAVIIGISIVIGAAIIGGIVFALF